MKHERPTDEVTGKVVAEKEGWTSYELFPMSSYPFVEPSDESFEVRCRSKDPRDSDPAAMDLLGWVLENWKRSTNTLWYRDGSWLMQLTDGSDYIIGPTGSDFRYAVVHLAAKVLEVK